MCPLATTCIAVGTNLSSTPYVVETSNNGDTWSLQTPPSNAVDLTGISCSAPEDCVAVGNTGNLGAGSTIMTTTTGGLSWTAQSPPSGTSRLEFGVVPDHRRLLRSGSRLCPCVGQRRSCLEPTIDSRQDVAGLNGISCVTSSDCTAVGFGIFGSPVIIGTVNAGTTWSAETVPSSVGVLTGVSCASSAICHAVSDVENFAPSIVATANGGATWTTEAYPGVVTNFTGISCPDSLHCTAVGVSSGGPNAVVLSTSDGGDTWVPQTTPAAATTLTGISCSSDHDLPGHRPSSHRHDQRRLQLD